MYLKISLYSLLYANKQLMYHFAQVGSHFGILHVIIKLLPKSQNNQKGNNYE